MKIYCGNLSYSMTDEDLKEVFSQYGEVAKATIVTDRQTGQSKGFGFVEMNQGSEAQAAIDELNGTTVGGRKINVNEARPREDRGPRRF
ncbi:MAG: RNA-binding protein [Candidatus Lambdaproteobacteria bacterium RIFOXYD1_FULL_56_27]|uniref:RNA-binding protein n=1 Tax=Candidatus Lambdaproteobacteria bacterium RIFOXYD2_FULL_56_26 TaxID=1817773 RepID=A0A1F6H018_9PROT|nr:MAG: RNA-binding protein [Candidatus Lambdaproteobacteria bacterium RIFOXYC1_FULL_56_13]OGH03624.1 MAG: RNA-binding protein [Candidatus Lambdaproteobacteria bacterium RIFOXYD2_FULL_56_26]OGH06555.1 MAG: RNA-binding protein [Candidatus Lambdaproteobacteria bacterium RIFOXYD1_FULL_56_27]